MILPILASQRRLRAALPIDISRRERVPSCEDVARATIAIPIVERDSGSDGPVAAKTKHSSAIAELRVMLCLSERIKYRSYPRRPDWTGAQRIGVHRIVTMLASACSVQVGEKSTSQGTGMYGVVRET